MQFKAHPERNLRHIVSAPFIYGMFIPLVALDVGAEIYHRVCFPLYGLPYVLRSKYIRLDRYKLPYLELYEKLNCLYCEYANGLLSYVSKIAAETEGYWCGIKHKDDETLVEQPHQSDFIEYGNEEKYRETGKK